MAQQWRTAAALSAVAASSTAAAAAAIAGAATTVSINAHPSRSSGLALSITSSTGGGCGVFAGLSAGSSSSKGVPFSAPSFDKQLLGSFLSRSASQPGMVQQQQQQQQRGSTKAAASAEDGGATLPETMTEFMVDMKCEGCVKNVRRNVEPVEGVSNVDVDLAEKVVRVRGTTTIQALEDALKKTGLSTRLIGRGDPHQAELTAAVAEFKGPVVRGVVRFTQASMEVMRIEAAFDGLAPNARPAWAVNQYGDLTRGVASTGACYDSDQGPAATGESQKAGDLGQLETDEKGHTYFTGTSDRLKVWDLIGRAVVVHPTTPEGEGVAAVIARSAGVGQNHKSLCLCDGTVIWEATDSDYVIKGTAKAVAAEAAASAK